MAEQYVLNHLRDFFSWLIHSIRRGIHSQVARGDSSPSDLEHHRKWLAARIEKWRKSQKEIASQLGDLVATQAISKRSVDAPEKELLYLPSQLSLSERTKLNLVDLGRQELLVQEGVACDAVQKLRTIIKMHVAMEDQKRSQAYGQDHHTKASGPIREIKARRDLAMADYHAAREAMVFLGMNPDSASFSVLTFNDLSRKATNKKRAVGDSQRTDGMIWTQTGVSGGMHHAVMAPAAQEAADHCQLLGTQSVRAKHI